MTDEATYAREKIRAAFAIMKSEVAADKGCQVDDLTLRIADALENYGLECYRLGQEDNIHERPTQPTEVPEGLFERANNTIPGPPWLPAEFRPTPKDSAIFPKDEVTPARSIRARKKHGP